MGVVLLVGYCTIIAGISFLGGKISERIRLTHTRTQILMSFISGFMIGIAVEHLLPHSLVFISGVDAMETVTFWLLMGIILMALLQRAFHTHQHDLDDHDHDHDHDHGHAVEEKPPSLLSSTGLVSIILGLGFHALIEGIALGSSIKAGLNDNRPELLLGLGVFFAIILHKPLDAYSIVGMARSEGHSQKTCFWINIIFALFCPIMTVLTFLGMDILGPEGVQTMVGRALALASGAFLCIALSDLLPEIQFHRHDRLKLTAFFLLGITVSYALRLLEH